jgi:hypothetical protein
MCAYGPLEDVVILIIQVARPPVAAGVDSYLNCMELCIGEVSYIAQLVFQPWRPSYTLQYSL